MRMTLLIAVTVLAACANPEVVRVEQPSDYRLSCTELEREMAKAEDFKEEAQDERGVTGKNTAAVLFFWPALVGTYMNTDEAIDAAEDREAHLMSIYRQKGCAGEVSRP